MISNEKKEQLLGHLDGLSGGELSVEQMEAIDAIRSMVEAEEDIDAKYRELESGYAGLAEENARVVAAYRERWDNAKNGTVVNGQYVDKVVEDVTEYSYDKLLGGK